MPIEPAKNGGKGAEEIKEPVIEILDPALINEATDLVMGLGLWQDIETSWDDLVKARQTLNLLNRADVHLMVSGGQNLKGNY